MKHLIQIAFTSIIVLSSLDQMQVVTSTECNCNCPHELTNGRIACGNLSVSMEELSDVNSVTEQQTAHMHELKALENRVTLQETGFKKSLRKHSREIRTLRMKLQALARRLRLRGVKVQKGGSSPGIIFMDDGDLVTNGSNQSFSMGVIKDISIASHNLPLESFNKTLLEEHLQRFLNEHEVEIRGLFMNVSFGKVLRSVEETQLVLESLKVNMTMRDNRLNALEGKTSNLKIVEDQLNELMDSSENIHKRIAEIRKDIQDMQSPKGDAELADAPGIPGPKGDFEGYPRMPRRRTILKYDPDFQGPRGPLV